MSCAVPPGSINPFGQQRMQEVVDRLQIHSDRNKFLTRGAILVEGVFVTALNWTSDKSHKHYMDNKLYAVADRCGPTSVMRHITFDRKFRRSGTVVYNPRGGKIFGSRDNLCDFMAKVLREGNTTFDNIFNPSETGFYWESYHQQPLSMHPYMDIDIKTSVGECKFNDVFKPIWEAIKLMEEIIKKGTSMTEVQVLVLMNTREVVMGNGIKRIKWSFHLHWPQIVVTDMTELAQLVADVGSRVPKQPNGEPLLDTKPYAAHNQLFRMPYCGKMGEGMSSLEPICPYKDSEAAGWMYRECKQTVASVLNQSCTTTPFPEKYTTLKVFGVSRSISQRPATMVGVVAPSADNRVNLSSWLDFWGPVLTNIVVPNFIRFRETMAEKLEVQCAFPSTDSFKIRTIMRLARFPASFRLEVDGDNFCEYDHGHTPYGHSFNSNAISYVADLHTGRICQQCVKCRPRVLKWYSFIKARALDFPIMHESESKLNADEFVRVGPHTSVIPFVLTFYKDIILFARDTRSVMVYNEKDGIWTGGSDGNRLLLAKVGALNDAHNAYCVSRNALIRDMMVAQYASTNPDASQDEIAANEEKQDAACRKANIAIHPIWKVTIPQRKDLLSSLKADFHHHQVEGMEPHHHLVPLNGMLCMDIYTWKLRKIEPNDYFVSCLNADIVHLKSDEVAEFEKWQLDVCCGDKEYFEYKLCILGLSLTMMNFDRAFYMPLGPAGRNGKSSESFLLNQVTMSKTPARGYYLAREYLSRNGQDKKGANAPDTVLVELANKCVIIADECRDTVLDGALIKSLVSCDITSARNLFASERVNVESRGKLWIIANKTLKLGYDDPALMDRLRILPYNARWVANPAEVKAGMTDLKQSLWVFKEDAKFKDGVLAHWGSAMVTSCLFALYTFLSNLKLRDPDNISRPLTLESIPPPRVVVDTTRAVKEQQHPVLCFVRTYMTKSSSSVITDHVTVDAAFKQFQQFGRNENSQKIKNMPRSTFQEQLLKIDIDVHRDEATGNTHFKNYAMSKDVPILQGTGNDSFAMPPSSYNPPPANNKRYRDHDGDYDAY